MTFLSQEVKGKYYPNKSIDHIAVLQNSAIKIFKYDDGQKVFSENIIPLENIETTKNSKRPRHLLFLRTPGLNLNDEEIYGVLFFISSEKKATMLNEITLVNKNEKISLLKHKKWEIPGQVVGLYPSYGYCSNNNAEYILYQFYTGNIFQFELLEDSINDFPLYERSMPFIHMYEIESDGVKTTIGLTQNQKLFIDDKLISSDCTSLFIYGNFLLFTTLSSGLSHLLFLYNVHEQKFRTLMVKNRDNYFQYVRTLIIPKLFCPTSKANLI